MKLNQIVFVTLICCIAYLPAQTQTCDCTHAETLQPAGSWYNDFNCYQYVKAYYKDNHWGAWQPPYYNSIAANHSSSNITSDPDFQIVSDPAQAGAVVYPCGHASVVLSSGCLIEKVGYGSELRLYGLNNGSCGLPTNVTYYKYVNRGGLGIDTDCLPSEPEPNCDVNCNITGTVNGSSLNTVNWVSSYYNSVSVSCSEADHFTWTKTSGSSPFFNCSNSSCSNFYFYLNSGNSVTFQVKAFDECDDLITSRNVTFVRNSGGGGGWGYLQSDGQTEEMEQDFNDPSVSVNPISSSGNANVYPNPAKDKIFVNWEGVPIQTATIVSLSGQAIHSVRLSDEDHNFQIDLPEMTNGVYSLNFYDLQGHLVKAERIIIQR